ncbi:MAG: hypothetical protein AAB225_22670 [Acidobacteriota bacterium]
MTTVPFTAAILLGGTLLAQDPPKAPIASKPPIEITGRITKVGLAFGQGMPSVEVQAGARTWKVWLGSMRYLVQQNFNPKAGQEVTIKGFQPAADSNEMYAASITLTETKQTIRLRDDSGWPLWRGGGGPQGGRHRGPQQGGRFGRGPR